MNETAIINEIRRLPILTAYNAIAPFLQVRRKVDDKPLERVHSLNISTGEAQIIKLDAAGQIALDKDKQAILETVYLDLKLYYIAFKLTQ